MLINIYYSSLWSTVIPWFKTICPSSSLSCELSTRTRSTRTSTRSWWEDTWTLMWTWRTSACSGLEPRLSSSTTPMISRSWETSRRCWRVTGKSEWNNFVENNSLSTCPPLPGSKLKGNRSRTHWERRLRLTEGKSMILCVLRIVDE